MDNLFPRALLLCIGEGRQPLGDELSLMTDKVCREVFPHASEGERRQAMRIAQAALGGHQFAA